MAWNPEVRAEMDRAAERDRRYSRVDGFPDFPTIAKHTLEELPRRRMSEGTLASELGLAYEAGYEHGRAVERAPSPVPMLLWCPSCGERHHDVGEFATKPHHTHACQDCGMVWRPAIVATVGVFFLPGFKNDSSPAPRAAESKGDGT